MKRKSLLFMLLLALLAPWAAKAQDLRGNTCEEQDDEQVVYLGDYEEPLRADRTVATIGTGTSTTHYPLPGYFGWQYDVYLYTPSAASFLSDACTISSIAYNVSSTSSSSASATIWLKDVDASTTLSASSTFSSFTSGATQVYNSSQANSSTGWNTYSFSSNFSHQAGKALLVIVKGIGCSTSGGCSRYCYCTSASNTHWYKHQDSSDPGTSVSGTIDGNRSNIQVTYTVASAHSLTGTIQCGGTVSGTLGTSGGTWGTGTSPYNMNTSWGVGAEHVYAFTPEMTGTHTIAFNTTSGDPDFWVLSANNPQTAIYATGGGNQPAELTAGHTYYLVADNYSSSNSAGYSIQVICPEPPVTVEVGSNSSNNSYIPTSCYYNYSLSQQIYKASEIGHTGTISQLSYYYNASTSDTRTIVIYMKMTSNNTLSSYDSSPGTVVYSGSRTFTQGWNTITLSTSFNYSNICQNLMITVDDNTGSYTSSRNFATYSTGENRTLYGNSDGTNYSPTSSNSLSSTQYNNYIKLYMTSPTAYKILTASSSDLTMGSFSLNPSGTNCSSGNYYAYSTGTTVTLTASATSGNTFVNWTVDGTTVTANPTTITMNDHHTVVANFSENPASIPYTENFESNTWKFVNGSRTNKWYRGAAGARNGSYGLFISNDGSNNTYDIGSEGAVWTYKTINFDETTNYAISFDWRAYAESCCDYIRVGLVPASTTLTDGSGFTTPTGWIDLNGSSGLNYQTAWQRKTVIQNVTAGNYKLAFCWRNDGSVGTDPPAAIDNIEVRKALTVAVSAGTGGSVSGGGTFALNQRCTVTATPNSNYCFSNWTESGTVVSSNPTYTFDVTANRTLVANFVSANNITVSGNTTVNCGNTTTLTAGGLSGVTYEWYSDASCTNLVATGASLTTPVLYDNTTYYVKAVKESVREQYSTFDYTGSSQSYSIPSGASALKMEVWGAQGGGRQVDGNSNGGYGGNGGYSVGTLTNLSGVSSVYVYVGGQGQTSMRQTEVAAPGGWNGGGTAFSTDIYDPACGGGGATDIRVNNNTLYYRIMVAGGGGGGGEDGEQGGYGGGTTGGTGSSSSTTGGSTTSGGTGSAFGIGASTQYDGGAGGGGWYGGGALGGSQTIPTSNSTSDGQGGCGGSGYVWTSSTSGQVPSGYGVSSSYYLTDAQTIGGGSSMPNPSGGTMTGREGNGYARITAIFNEVCETQAKAVTVTVNQPAAPTNVQVTNIGLITATASWSGSASSYKWRIDSGAWYTTNNTSVNLTGLTPGQTYTFRVKAVGTGTCESDEATATFTTQNTHTVTVSANPNNGGTVSGGGTITHGTNCTVTATPATGWHFVSWTEGGTVMSNSASYTFQVNADHNLVANFEQTNYTLTVYYKYRDESQAANTYTHTYHYGDSYTVNSPTITGYTPTQATVNGSMPADNVTVTVYYDINTYTVSIVSNNVNYGTVSTGSIANVPYGTAITTSGNTLTINGTTVTATAETSDAQYTYAFSGWSGVPNPAEVTGAITITANFTQTVNTYTVSFVPNDNSYGTVSPVSVTVPYGSTFTESGNTLTVNNTTVTATPAQATAQYTYAFDSWSGIPQSVTGNTTVTANFTATTNAYTVTIVPNDGTYGTVSTSSIANVPYGTTLSTSGTTLTVGSTTVTATPETNTAQYTYAFSDWTSAGSSVPATVTGDITITANFTRTTNEYTVTVVCNNDNYGTVSTGSIANVPYGTAIATSGNTLTVNGTTVTATPAQATAQYTYAFDSWTGVPSPAEVTGNVTITANFTATTNAYTVTIVPNDANFGSVSPTSVADVPYGTSVTTSGNTLTIGNTTVTATAATYGGHTYVFNDWSNVPQTITADVTITANFIVTPPTVTLQGVDPNTTYADARGNVVANGNTIREAGFIWSTSPNPVAGGTGVNRIASENLNSVTGDFSARTTTPMTANTMYYMRAYVVDSDANYYYSADQTFYTLYSVTTDAVSDLHTIDVTLNGSYTTGGGDGSVLGMGFVYGTAADPTIGGSGCTQVTLQSPYSTPFTADVTGLTGNTAYHVRAYVTNEGGTSYGADVAFTTDRYYAITAIAAPAAGGSVTFSPRGDGTGSLTHVAEIGTGTSNPNNFPFLAVADYSFCEMLYPHTSEMVEGDITHISFHNIQVNGNVDHNIRIYMKNVENTTLTALLPIAASDECFDGRIICASGAWADIELDTPFAYDGSSTLLVAVYYYGRNITGQSSSQNQRRWYATAAANTCVGVYDSSTIDPLNPSGTATSSDARPNAKFTINTASGDTEWYHYGYDAVTLTAVPKPGYGFVNWTENGSQVSANAAYTLTNIVANHTLTANFNLLYKRFVVDGNWNVSGSWLPVGVPTATDNVSIEAHATIPSGVVAEVDEIVNIASDTASLKIADGGQLRHNNAANDEVTVTIEKYVEGYTNVHYYDNYTYSLISSPANVSAADFRDYTYGFDDPHQNFFYFDYANTVGGELLEWVNNYTYGANDTVASLVRNRGYLYASLNTTTLGVTGEVMASNVDQEVNLAYTANSDLRFNGWNLMGNPFVCNAYVAAVDANGDAVPANYYVLNSEGNDFTLPSSNYIEPAGAMMVRAYATGDKLLYSRDAINLNNRTGMLDVAVAYDGGHNDRGVRNIDRARVRFGEGRNFEKLQLDPSHTCVYIPVSGNDYSVVYAQPVGVIPVNFRAEHNGDYTLSFSTDGVTFNYLHLIDNMTGADVDLLTHDSYSFSARMTDYESRFKLVFATNEVGEGDGTGSGNFAFNMNGTWVVYSDGEATLQVVDVLGHILSSERISGTVSKAIQAAPGVYMLRLIQGENVNVQKIVIER